MMKIVFDSEEQMEMFFENMICCPSALGLKDLSSKECLPADACRKCWECSGVEIEVAT